MCFINKRTLQGADFMLWAAFYVCLIKMVVWIRHLRYTVYRSFARPVNSIFVPNLNYHLLAQVGKICYLLYKITGGAYAAEHWGFFM